MGWVLLAHGETVGHGAPRHQTRLGDLHFTLTHTTLLNHGPSALRIASVICILPHIAPTGRRALSAER